LPPERVGKVMECPHCHEKARFSPAEDKPVTPAPPVQFGSEETFFNESGIAVTRTRFVAGVQTFAMSGITSVRMEKTEPGVGFGMLLIILGAVCLLVTFGIFVSTLAGGRIAAGVFAAFFGGAFGLGLIIGGTNLERGQRPAYHVVLSTSGGEVKAYTSPNIEFVARLTGALNNAIIARG
jgi:hypothetical protein